MVHQDPEMESEARAKVQNQRENTPGVRTGIRVNQKSETKLPDPRGNPKSQSPRMKPSMVRKPGRLLIANLQVAVLSSSRSVGPTSGQLKSIARVGRPVEVQASVAN